MPKRDCDAIACTAPVASGKLMCLAHWRLVPVPLQNSINDRYRTLRKDYAFLRDLIYLQACVTAIDRIAAAEGNQGINPYLRHMVAAQKRAQQ